MLDIALEAFSLTQLHRARLQLWAPTNVPGSLFGKAICGISTGMNNRTEMCWSAYGVGLGVQIGRSSVCRAGACLVVA